jgi:4-amino-4-deoxy-L-arabinose transferase-like glycosyltransferase
VEVVDEPRPRRRLALEVVLVAIVSFVALAPGIGRYSLVDPWETHYGEVARNMLVGHDLVWMQWPGTNGEVANEGFRSKPVLTFWLMSAGLRAVGVDASYSGELVESSRTMIGIRLPFVCCAVAGLMLVWWMLAKLVSRRLAWLSLLVVGSCPFFCLVARQGIPDMPLCATVMGALSLFLLAVEDGDRPIEPFAHLGRFPIDARVVVLGLAGGFIAVQAIYYCGYFIGSPKLAFPGTLLPEIWLPASMVLALAALWSRPWRFVHRKLRWRGFAMAPLTTMRQVYLIGCYSLLGVSVLAKGPPGLAVVGGVGILHVACFHRWRALYAGAFEIKRGVIVMLATFLPWHVAMYLKDGLHFISEYVYQHLLDRAAVGSIDKSFGTFEHYTSQLGYGMWIWAALVPAAVITTVVATRPDSRVARLRFHIALWAVVAVAFFGLVQTKYHHYILPAVPALGILVAFFLDDLLAGRARLHPAFAAVGVAIALFVCRDLVHQPQRWIEMFTFRYDRPWPSGDPWQIDPSDGFLVLGVAGAVSIALAATRFRKLAVAALCASGVATALWALHVYMPIAGAHWGMRSAMRTYYQQRTIYGDKLVYFGAGELADDWQDARDTWSLDTFIPDTLQIGQPMTISIEVRKADDERVLQNELALTGAVTAIGDHTVEITLAPGERAKLAPLIHPDGPRGRPPIRAVDADRLISWGLYWRGDQFWSQGEIWGWLPAMKTTFVKGNSGDTAPYLNDRARAPLGRRYFVITDAGKASAVRSLPPTQRGRDTFEIVDTTSNKFTLVAFWL